MLQKSKPNEKGHADWNTTYKRESNRKRTCDSVSGVPGETSIGI